MYIAVLSRYRTVLSLITRYRVSVCVVIVKCSLSVRINTARFGGSGARQSTQTV